MSWWYYELQSALYALSPPGIICSAFTLYRIILYWSGFQNNYCQKTKTRAIVEAITERDRIHGVIYCFSQSLLCTYSFVCTMSMA